MSTGRVRRLAAAPDVESVPEVKTFSVLIAEDDPLVSEVLSAMISSDQELELIGVADDAHSAIAMAIDEQPDLVLLDVEMPGGGGPAAARTISSVCPHVRVVAISAHSDKEHVLSMVHEGASGYVVKGAEPTELLDTVRRCARGETVFVPPSALTMMRENVIVARDMARAEADRVARVARLRELCEDGSIEVVFQPIADLMSGRVFAAEALARFPRHPELDTGGWFDEATELGMCATLELAALRAAVEEIRHCENPDLSFAINLSPETLREPEMAGLIEGLESQLIVEITEHQRIDDYDAVNITRELLRERGVRVAIDDTGAGFASLRHIIALKPDLVKLDISIVRDVDRDTTRSALAKGLVTMAREIGTRVVAEGIERRAELACMREMGADYGQGWLISRPVPMAELCRLESRLV
jgi:EAL domain-containing protein (putative c-di-GMP-specific phosphodiesterase class I)/ActR/RegA family two-component response regulator